MSTTNVQYENKQLEKIQLCFSDGSIETVEKGVVIKHLEDTLQLRFVDVDSDEFIHLVYTLAQMLHDEYVVNDAGELH